MTLKVRQIQFISPSYSQTLCEMIYMYLKNTLFRIYMLKVSFNLRCISVLIYIHVYTSVNEKALKSVK